MIRFGLVGAGPWAAGFHAPMFARADGVTLAGVWARRPSAAAELAGQYGAVVASSPDELLTTCDAVAFAVPPDVQAELAPRAAAAGKHLLLEKPLAFELADAERVAAAVGSAGVASLMVLRNRFDPAVVRFLDAVEDVSPRALIGRTISAAALPPSRYATPWRVERGALLDVAPHVLDLAVAALGPVEQVTAAGDPTRWIALTTVHASGAVGQFSFSLTVPCGDGRIHLEVVHDGGTLHLEPIDDDVVAVQRALMARFVEVVATGEPHDLDVRRGLELQRVIDAAARAL